MPKMTCVETVYNDKPYFKIACDCKTHAADANSAFIPRKVAGIKIHGLVTMINDPNPMMRAFNAKKGYFAA